MAPPTTEPTAPQPVLDVHAHAMPLPLLTWLAAQGRADVDAAGEVVRLDPAVSGVGPGTPLPLARSQHDVAARLEEMTAAGVDLHAVSLPPFLFCSTASDGALVAEVVRRGNEALAEYVSGAPDRLTALGSVPLGWPGAAEEARHCLDELGAAGIAIGSRGGGHDLDDPVHEELWALLAERRAFVFLHPSGVPDAHRLREFYLPQLAGYPMETALAVARLVFGGVLERHALTLCLAHGGGCLPAIRGRFDLGWERKDVARTTAARPSELTARLYYDTAVFDPRALARLVEDFGADHVLLGTDHPFELGDRDPVGSVRAAGLDDADAAAVLGGTAAALLGIPTAAVRG